VYDAVITYRTYEKFETLSKDVLNGRNSVVVDAMFLMYTHWHAFFQLAARCQVPIVLLDSQQASTDELRRRIGQGLQGPQGVSEASLKVL
jgi:predicted kinase